MDLKEICQTLSREIQKLVPYDRLAINILQKDQKFFSVYAEESRLPAPAIPAGFSVREETATGWVLGHKKPVICRDVRKDRRFPLTHQRYKKVGLRSYVILPLIVEGKVLGALNLASLRPGRYGSKEVKLLSPVAEILSLAIENSNLYEESQKQEEMQKLLKELSQDITSLDVDSLLKKLTEKVRQILTVDVSDVRIFEHEQGKWMLRGISGIDPDLIPSARTGTALGRSGWIIKNRRPLVIRDTTQAQDLPSGETIKSLGLRGYLAVPLLSRGVEVIGVLRALTYHPRDFTQDDVDLLQQLANGAALVLENARLFEEVRLKSRDLEATNLRLNRLLREQSALRAIFAQINLLDLGPLLHQLSEQALSLLKVDHIQVRLLNKDGILRTVALAGKGSERFQDQLLISGRGRSSLIMERQGPVAIRDIGQDKLFGPGRLMGEMGVKGYLGVPLISRQHKSIGVLLATSLEEREFTPEEISLAQQFAAGAAIAIENARLFEEVQKTSAELRDAFKAKSDFLNTMAHELRTPLNVIIGTQQLLLDGFYGELTEEQRRGLAGISRHAQELLQLVNEILDLARLEARGVPVHTEEFLVHEITDDLESSFKPVAREKGLELKFEVGSSLPPVKSDRAKIREILENLLANAIKYTDRGRVELRVSLQPQDSNAQCGQLLWSVRDTGIGISESDLPRLFEPFYMAENLDRRKYPGTGLGLSIVKRLVELLNGSIQVESQWEKGSTFTVTLPLVHPVSEGKGSAHN